MPAPSPPGQCRGARTLCIWDVPLLIHHLLFNLRWQPVLCQLVPPIKHVDPQLPVRRWGWELLRICLGWIEHVTIHTRQVQQMTPIPWRLAREPR
jgi:hypothetical protein